LGILISIITVPILTFLVLKKIFEKKKLSTKHFQIIYALCLLGLGVLFLAITGRLHPIFALLGAALPFLVRIFGIFMRGAQIASIFRNASSLFGNTMSTPRDSSEIKTSFIHMKLDHATGSMDGQMLRGHYEGKKLSLLSIDEIKEILSEIESDSDSLNLMHAYLERERPEWEEVLEETGSKSSETLSSDMNEQQAFEILGLSQDASDKEIVAAHKRLMQGVHPDRGGSTFLAAKINAAKDLLLG
jgi:hypothetical protein